MNKEVLIKFDFQNVLKRYEEDFETISQEKEALLNELSFTQKELKQQARRSTVNSQEKTPSIQVELKQVEESFSCQMEAESMDLSVSGDVPETNLSMESLASQQALKDADIEKQKLQDQVLELQQQLALKETELSESRLSLERVVNMIKENEDSANKQEAEQELKSLQQSYEEARANIQQLLDDKHSLDENWKLSCEELAAVRQELLNVQQMVVAAQSKDPIDGLEEDLESPELKLKQELEECQGMNTKLTSDLADAVRKADELQSELESKNNDLESIEAKLRQEFESCLNELNSKSEEYQQVNEKLVSDLAESTRKVEELQLELDSKTGGLKSIEANLRQEFESSLNDLNTKFEEHLQTNAKLISELAESTKKVEQLQSELDSKTDHFNPIEAAPHEESESCSIDSTQVTKEYSQENEKLVSELTETTKKVDHLQSELDSKTDDLKSIEAKLREEFESTLNELRRKAEEYQTTNEQLISDLADSTRKMDELQSELNSKSDDLKSIETKLRVELESSLNELNSKTEECQQMKSAEAKLREEYEFSLNELNGKLVEYLQLNAKLVSDLEKSTQKVDELQSELNSKADDLKSIEAKLREEFDSSNHSNDQFEEYQRTSEKLASDLAESTKKVAELQSELDSKTNDLNLIEAKLRSEFESSLNELSNEANEKLVSELAESTKQVNHLQSELESTTAALNSIEAKLSEELQSSKDLSHKYEEYQRVNEKLVCDLAELTKQMDESQSELNTKIDNLKSVEAKLRQELESALLDLKDTKRDLEHAASKSEESDEMIETLTLDIHEATNKIDYLQSQLDRKSTALETVSNELESQSSKLQQTLNEMEVMRSEVATSSGLKSQVEELRRSSADEASQLACRINQLEEEGTSYRRQLQVHEDVASQNKLLSQQVDQLQSHLEQKQIELSNLKTVTDHVRFICLLNMNLFIN